MLHFLKIFFEKFPVLLQNFTFSEQNIASQSVTPFILARVNELTQGASMATSMRFEQFFRC